MSELFYAVGGVGDGCWVASQVAEVELFAEAWEIMFQRTRVVVRG